MMLFSYFELAASLFILLLAFYIYNRHYACRIARFYARFALIAFLAAIFEYSMRIAFTLGIAQAINRISVSLWVILFAMFVHFALIFTKQDDRLKKGLNLYLLYGPAAILITLFCFTNIMYQRYEIQNIGIASQPAPAYWLFTIYGLTYALYGVYQFFLFSRSGQQKIERTQAAAIVMGSLFPLLIAIVTDEVLPLVMGYRIFPPLCVFALAAMNLSIFIAMRKYSLFAITPAYAADTIIKTMPDPLLITDLEGVIMLANDEADKLLHCSLDQIEGCNISTLFKQKVEYEKLYNEVVEQNKEILRFPADILDRDGEIISSLINANKLHDSLGATLGVVWIIH